MREITKEDKLFYLGKSFFTLDGLWMIETEAEADWNITLKIDTIVWIRLMKTIFRRLKRYLGMESNTLQDLLKILAFRWTIEGWDYKLVKNELNEIIIEVKTCPYKAAMDRNPKRHDKIPLICNDMCRPFYNEIVHEFNPDIKIERDNFQGLGDPICRFKFTTQEEKNISKEKLTLRNLTLEDKLFYFERNFLTLDGLWMVETEKELGFDKTLKIDIVVWQRLYSIIFKRLIKYLKIQERTLQNLMEILAFCFKSEGYEYKVIKNDPEEAILYVTLCPWNAAMERNPERHDKMESICKDMCIPFFLPAIEEFNPKINLIRKRFIGAGDPICDFHFTFKI